MINLKSKVLAILMAVTMVFAMAPLTAGVAFAEDESVAPEGVEAVETDVTEEGVTEEDVTEGEAVETDGTEEEVVEEALPGDLEVKGEARATGYNLWVGNTQVSDSVKSGPGWKYSGDAAKGTLALTNANITTGYTYSESIGTRECGIFAPMTDLTIVSNGKNTIDLSGVDSSVGIMATNLTITGTGSLNVKGNIKAIYCNTSIVIQDTIVNAEAPKGSSYAVIHTKNGSITIRNSIVTASSPAQYAILAEYRGINIVGTAAGRYNTRVEATTGSDWWGSVVANYGGNITLSGVKILEPASAGVIQDGDLALVGVQNGSSWSGSNHVVIGKATNPLKVSGKTAKIKYKKLKKKNQTLAVSKVITFGNKGAGTLTYTKVSGNKKITINKTTGKVTVKKRLKKGTYTVKVNVTAAGSGVYGKVTKTVSFKIKVKK